MLTIDIITIFPKMFKEVFDESIIKRAQDKKKVKIRLHDLRDYALSKHRKVDDRPFGGGSGMVMGAQPIFDAVIALKRSYKKRSKKEKVVLMCPKGKKLNQALSKSFSELDHIILICGHYEGVDERVRKYLIDEEISIGDYVLTGGELPAMVLVDSIIRLVPGVLGDKNSLIFESFQGNLLEYPQYTRPANFRGMQVPAVLLSGNHKEINKWREKESLSVTRRKRPELLKGALRKKYER